MPASSGLRDARLVRNCQLRRPAPSDTTSKTSAASVISANTRVLSATSLEREIGPVPHGYSSRKRSRSQVLTRFSPNVIRNSSMPTAKMVRYSSVPCGVSPRLTCTM